MRITDETIEKIESIFSFIQVTELRTVQRYDPMQEYRQHCVFAVDWKFGSCEKIYVNIEAGKFTPWRKKMFDKRKKDIPHNEFIEFVPEHNIIRIGFK